MAKHKRNDKANVDDEERVSMNSLGNLHGRVDFFGIETQRANKPIYQKLKVAQKWIFIEALMIVLLTAYIILLSVWLAPFFPANYDTDEEADYNTVAISSLQSEQSNTHGQVDINTVNIGDLREWRRNHTDQFDEMIQAIRTLERQVNDLQNQTATLNSTANQLEQEVANLTEQNKVQEERISDLERRVFDLETAAAAHDAKSARTSALTDQNNARIKKLEGFQENMTERVGDLDGRIQEQIFNVTMTIGGVQVQCMNVQNQTTALTARMASQRAHQDIFDIRLQNLTLSINELEDSNAKDHKAFEQEISGLKTNFSQQMVQLQNQTKFIGKTLHTTIQNHAQWARESFKEQDDLRAAAMKKQRIVHEAGIGILQFGIDSLNATVQENLQMCKATTANNTQNAINQAQRMVEEAKTDFKEQDDLRAAAMEKQRIEHEAGIGILQFGIDSLNATVQENLQMCKATTANNTQNAINQAQRMVEEAKTDFKEQDDLRAAAMEKQRIEHEAGIGILQFGINSLNATVQENLQMCKATTANNAQNAINQGQRMVEEAKTELEGLVEDTKKNVTEKIKKVNSTLTQKLDAVESEVIGEIKERELQYVYLCDRIDGVQQSSYENFTIAQAGIKRADDEIQNLTKEIDSMQEQGMAQEGRLSDLNQKVEKRALEFVQFQAETVATELDLRNQTCSLQEDLSILEGKQAVLIVRVNNTENRINDVEFKLSGAILQTKAEFIRQLAVQHEEQTDITARTNNLQDAYSQTVAYLGGTDIIKTLAEKIAQILPQLSTPRPVSTNGPTFAESTTTLTAKESAGTTPMADSDYSDSDDDYDYDEQEE